MIRVLFVCLGNICRSPMAEGVFRDLVEKEGLQDRISIDSAGTGGWHIGSQPDQRAQQTMKQNGIDISGQRGRQVQMIDFEQFDFILAMDEDNYEKLLMKAPGHHAHKVRLYLTYTPHLALREVPDPYYGSSDGFAHVFNLVKAAGEGLLGEIKGILKL